MRYVSLCSGVEATTVAWLKLGWTPLAFAEIDPFACAVLANRFPDVPNLGDISKIDWGKFYDEYGNIDVLFASTPCQSFSIAGNRLGVAGESGLMFEFVRAARELIEASGGGCPRYILWENVPGALSSGPKGAKGEDFGCLLRELDKCGFGLSWRILDSQFARIPDGEAGGFRGPVPQRRRRVYLVGSLGTDGSAEILFERTSMRRDNPTGRKVREVFATDIDEGIATDNQERESNLICMADTQMHTAIEENLASTFTSRMFKDPPIIIDRAAFNQGKNAQYPPHIEQTETMDTIVARGPHAVCYRMNTR